jgi:hypothetical protein
LKYNSEFEPPRPKAKDLVLLQKKKYLLPQTLELVLPFSPKRPCSPKQLFEYLNYLFPLLSNAFVVGHILTKLPMDLSMMWCP